MPAEAQGAKPVSITYFSDVLCVWAYIAQLRLDHVRQVFGDTVQIEPRFCSVFGDAHRKIASSWGAKDGFQAFNIHLREAAAAFPEVKLHPEIWLGVRPASSDAAHLFLKAVLLAEQGGALGAGTAQVATWAFRQAFFEEARDIARSDVQREIAVGCNIPLAAIDPFLEDGRAFAALSADYRDAEAMRIEGSPSFILNKGRQKLYGNIGFRVLAANILELQREPNAGQASWC